MAADSDVQEGVELAAKLLEVVALEGPPKASQSCGGGENLSGKGAWTRDGLVDAAVDLLQAAAEGQVRTRDGVSIQQHCSRPMVHQGEQVVAE